jgi:hypothetical protein
MRAKFLIHRIDCIRSSQRPNNSDVVIECDMTEVQMRDALLSFLESVTGETWEKWKKEAEEGT